MIIRDNICHKNKNKATKEAPFYDKMVCSKYRHSKSRHLSMTTTHIFDIMS